MGFRPMMASELEFYLLRDTYEEAAEKGWDDLDPGAGTTRTTSSSRRRRQSRSTASSAIR